MIYLCLPLDHAKKEKRFRVYLWAGADPIRGSFARQPFLFGRSRLFFFPLVPEARTNPDFPFATGSGLYLYAGGLVPVCADCQFLRTRSFISSSTLA